MSKKIYFGNKPLIITDKITEELKAYEDNKATGIMHEVSPAHVKTMINELKKSEIIAGIFMISSIEMRFAEIKKAFNLIQAAGGAVLNKENELLFIYRRGKWDLPKGKVDEGEELDACAVREVQEETGIQQIELKKLLCTTYHTYYEKEEIIL